MALVVTIAGATLLSYLIFRLVINTKLRDYAIFRTVGANQTVIQLLVYFENIITVIFSYILFVGLSIGIKNTASIDRYSVFYGLKYSLLKTISFFRNRRPDFVLFRAGIAGGCSKTPSRPALKME